MIITGQALQAKERVIICLTNKKKIHTFHAMNAPYRPKPSRFVQAYLVQIPLLPPCSLFSIDSRHILFCYILFSPSMSTSPPFPYYRNPPHPQVFCILIPIDQNTTDRTGKSGKRRELYRRTERCGTRKGETEHDGTG